MDFGLLVARLVFGITMSAHGAQKLFGLARVWTPDLIGTVVALGVFGGVGNLVVRSVSTHAAVGA